VQQRECSNSKCIICDLASCHELGTMQVLDYRLTLCSVFFATIEGLWNKMILWNMAYEWLLVIPKPEFKRCYHVWQKLWILCLCLKSFLWNRLTFHACNPGIHFHTSRPPSISTYSAVVPAIFLWSISSCCSLYHSVSNMHNSFSR